MEISSVIMAGGKGTRFDFKKLDCKFNEKLLLPLGDKCLIDYVIEAINASKYVNRLIIAISPFTPNLKSILKSKYKKIELFETPGIGYHSDLKYVIKKFNLGITLTIAADIPLITTNIIDEIIENYIKSKKPSLSVMSNVKLFHFYGLKPTMTIKLKYRRKKLVPLGVNIIDGKMIDLPQIKEIKHICNHKELLYNTNTLEDYFQLKKFFKQMKK